MNFVNMIGMGYVMLFIAILTSIVASYAEAKSNGQQDPSGWLSAARALRGWANLGMLIAIFSILASRMN